MSCQCVCTCVRVWVVAAAAAAVALLEVARELGQCISGGQQRKVHTSQQDRGKTHPMHQ